MPDEQFLLASRNAPCKAGDGHGIHHLGWLPGAMTVGVSRRRSGNTSWQNALASMPVCWGTGNTKPVLSALTHSPGEAFPARPWRNDAQWRHGSSLAAGLEGGGEVKDVSRQPL